MEGIKKEVPYSILVVIMNIIQDYLVAFIIVFSVKLSLLQIVPVLCIILAKALFVIIN